uniref:acid phosphatase n=1 Tax=Timema shepardi TaxID=629360 RepID=A0A7R9FZU7_TIMSH|nr:unnamed protein product [Timema shepardi]
MASLVLTDSSQLTSDSPHLAVELNTTSAYARRVEGWEKVDIMATSLTTNPRWEWGAGQERWNPPNLPVDTCDDLGTIIFSNVIFRHGDRTIISSYRNDPYNNKTKYWPRGYEQLTEIGEDQHFKQGSFFRKRYNHILPETYNVNDLYVRSSNIDRTLASAQAHLAGLYPPTEQNLAQPNINFQVIPIHTTDIVNDKVNYFNIKSGPILKEIIANTKAKVKGTLSPDRKLYIYSAHDSNIVSLLQGLKVFNGFLVPYASAVMIELRSKADEYFITVSYKNSTKIDPYLLQISGCDALCPLDSFVELTKTIIPDDLIPEGNERLNSSFLQVSYKNSTETDPHLLQLPGCDALCPLHSFVELTKPLIPDDLTTECAEEVVAGQEYHFEIPAAVLVVALLLSTGLVRSLPVDSGDDLGTITFSSSGEYFTLSTVLLVALLLSTGLFRSLPVDTGDDLGTITFFGTRKVEFKGLGKFAWRENGKPFRENHPQYIRLESNSDIHVIDSPVYLESDALKHVATEELFRHGDRAPTGAYPNDIYNDEAKYWPRGYGQLSEIGEEQHFKQGSFFRKRYNHILPETYNVNDTYELYNLPIPEWVNSYYPQPLRNLFLLESFIAAAGTEELQRLSTGPLLKEIITNTQAKVNGTLSPDRGLYIYSAHDSNVVDLLQGLDVFNGILVPYASAVLIELRSKSDEYFITVSYKNNTETDPYLLQLPGCDTLCPLDSFVELTKPIIPDDLTTECAEEVVAGQEYLFEIPAAAILPEWEHCFQQPTVKDGRFHRISFTTKHHK